MLLFKDKPDIDSVDLLLLNKCAKMTLFHAESLANWNIESQEELLCEFTAAGTKSLRSLA